MAMRRHISDVIKLSNTLNIIAARETVAAPAVILDVKKYSHRCHSTKSSSNLRSIPSSIFISPEIITLHKNVLRTSESETVSQEYQCPSRLAHRLSQMVIVDKQTIQSDYRLPLATSVISSLVDPQRRNETSEIKDPTSQHTTGKHAKEIMKIRHRKMKKHKLKKLRKRMYFVWRKQKLTRRAKRDAIYWKEVAAIKKDGDDFDAETFVKDQLEKARRGGFYINVFESSKGLESGKA